MYSVQSEFLYSEHKAEIDVQVFIYNDVVTFTGLNEGMFKKGGICFYQVLDDMTRKPTPSIPELRQ